MVPKVQVDASEFLRIVERENALVIRGPKVLWQGLLYVTRSDDYYYYTYSREPLSLPNGLEVRDALGIMW